MIVAVNGPAVGVGATMTLPADIRIAADTAKFGFVFARRGLVPEAASSWFLPRIVGISQAMEWVATGRSSTPPRRWQAARVPGRSCRRAHARRPRAGRGDRGEHLGGVGDPRPADAVVDAREPTPWDAHRLDSRAISVLGRDRTSPKAWSRFLEKRPRGSPRGWRTTSRSCPIGGPPADLR